MNKTELIKVTAQESGYKKADVEACLNALNDAIVASLKAGEDVKTGICTFTVKDTAARTGRNPKTGETIAIAASKKVSATIAPSVKKTIKE